MREAGPDDSRHMLRAVALARGGWGRVAPNPMVGAVLVRGGEVVGEGWHAAFGGDHAEVVALEAAGARAKGATLYVTLEPCTHTGKTPPCAPAVIAAGVGRVVVGCRDPDPQAGGGVEALRRAGLEVVVGVEGLTCARLLAAYLWRRASRAPFVALKLALSLDGALAREPGRRTAISGPEANRWVQGLRAGFDAILVGRGTVDADDPRLTVRGEIEPRKPPVRVILDAGLSLAPTARVVANTADAPTWIVCGPEAPASRRSRLQESGVRVLDVPASPAGVDLEAALALLAAEGVGTVLAEGGAKVARSLLEGGHVQRLHLLYAPVLYGAEAPCGFGGAEAEPDEWHVVERSALGQDTHLALDSRALVELQRRLGGPEASRRPRGSP